MPALRDIEQTVQLADGAVFEGLYDPSKDVGETETPFGTQYSFRFQHKDGRIVKLKGYQRLFTAMIEAIGTSQTPIKLRVTAHGKQGTTDRTFQVTKL
jgi:hypothetical protein